MYELYKYDPAVEQEFSPRKLIVCASLTTLNGGILSPVQECIPAGFLFAGRTMETTMGGHNLIENGQVVAFIEQSDEGCKYLLREDETVYVLVERNPFYDLCDIDLKIDIDANEDSYTVINNTHINGEHWANFDSINAAVDIGFQWAVTGIGNGEYGQLKYLPNGGYNQSGTKTALVTIGTNTLNDYMVNQSDIDDANDEYITLQMVWRPRGGSWKNASEVLRVKFSEFMEEYQ